MRGASPATAPGFNAGRVPATKGRRLPPEPLTRQEVEALLRQCSRRAPTGLRNRALIAVLYRGGLRISEALALRLDDLDAETGSVRVLHGKGDRARTVGLDAGAFALVESWLECRRRVGLDRTAPLFCTLEGQPLWASYVRQLLPRLGRKAGIRKRVHPHGLRHTLATELAAENVGLVHIQTQLGHRHISTTARYVHQLRPEHTIATMRERDWTPPGVAHERPETPSRRRLVVRRT